MSNATERDERDFIYAKRKLEESFPEGGVTLRARTDGEYKFTIVFDDPNTSTQVQQRATNIVRLAYLDCGGQSWFDNPVSGGIVA